MNQKAAEKKRIIENLNSPNTDLVLRTIKNLRQTGNVTTLPYLINVLHTTEKEEVRESIVSFLNDLKSQLCTEILVKAINNEIYHAEKEILVSACWQSGLDFSKYISDFIRISIQDNYQLSIEAFSVIENSVSNCSLVEINSHLEQVRSGLEKVDQNKKMLLLEMIKMMEEVKNYTL